MLVAGRRPRVSVYYRQREGYWTVRWREHGRQREDGGFKTEDEAEDHADTVRQRLRQGLPGLRELVPVRDVVANWWDSYVQTEAVQQATRETYKTDATRILSTLAYEDANSLSQATIRRWRDQIAKQHSPRAANKALTALSSAYQRALEHDPPLAERNPCRGVKRLPETRQPIQVPSRLHVHYLEKTAPSDRELAMLLVASRAGVRQSELLGLGWHNVRDGALWVAEVGDRKRTVRKSTKTKRSERRIPLPPTAWTALEAIRPPHPTGLVFPSPTEPDRPIARSAWAKVYWHRWRRTAAWEAAKDGHGADVWSPLLELEWKNLRHHAISRWAAGGASMLQASRWSGDSIATLDKHYAHLFDEDEAEVMQAID